MRLLLIFGLLISTLFLHVAAKITSVNISTVPSCAVNCVQTELLQANCGWDTTCICSKNTAVQSITACVQESCNKSEINDSFKIMKSACADSGVNIDVPIDEAQPTTNANPSSRTHHSARQTTNLAIGLGVGFGAGTLLIVAGAFTFIYLRRRQRRMSAATIEPERKQPAVQQTVPNAGVIYAADIKSPKREFSVHHELDSSKEICEAPNSFVVELEGSRRDALTAGRSWMVDRSELIW
ncbi:hypothetical protein BJ508DRAFT_335757 [Ascobolus immersus RN42]|uniref:CFEM domain-containing protein n=1 Tax=Ascobolus immersus RN42 TaxID=1160509 RepID=A0A3N4HB71_ASCIM|nr:hypothetical protein BJ508DRAFT_335757 [Ascobolus immersus RN42]